MDLIGLMGEEASEWFIIVFVTGEDLIVMENLFDGTSTTHEALWLRKRSLAESVTYPGNAVPI